jgi:hypothetical protein
MMKTLFRLVNAGVAALAMSASTAHGAASLDGAKDVYLSLDQAVSAKCGWGTAYDHANVTGAELQIGTAGFAQGTFRRAAS